MSLFLSLEEVYLIYGGVFSCLLDYISIQTDKNTLGSRRRRFKALISIRDDKSPWFYCDSRLDSERFNMTEFDDELPAMRKA